MDQYDDIKDHIMTYGITSLTEKKGGTEFSCQQALNDLTFVMTSLNNRLSDNVNPCQFECNNGKYPDAKLAILSIDIVDVKDTFMIYRMKHQKIQEVS